LEGVGDVHSGQLVVFVAAPHELAAEHPEIVAVPAHGLARQSLIQQVKQEWSEHLDDLLPDCEVRLVVVP
jgi:hypothetical protein